MPVEVPHSQDKPLWFSNPHRGVVPPQHAARPRREERILRRHDLLAVSSFYPGLELATTGVHWLTGLPLVGAQILVVLLARSVLVMALFTLVRRGTGSGTAGGGALLLFPPPPPVSFPPGPISP